MEICTNCGRPLSKDEVAYLLDSKVVCGKCRRRTIWQKIAALDVLTEQKMRWIEEGFFKSLGWIPAALLVGVVLFFGLKEYIAYRITEASEALHSTVPAQTYPVSRSPELPAFPKISTP
jgi:hypothetical protein